MGDRNARSDGGDGPRLDRPILEDIRDGLRTAPQFESVRMDATEGQTRLEAVFDPASNPPSLARRVLDIRWYTNDDFSIHYREDWDDGTCQRRWDRHPNAYNSRDHFHPPPDAGTPGEDRSWPTEYRDVMARVVAAVGERDADLRDDPGRNG